MRALHAEIRELVNRAMWSREDQFYWDLAKDDSFKRRRGSRKAALS